MINALYGIHVVCYGAVSARVSVLRSELTVYNAAWYQGMRRLYPPPMLYTIYKTTTSGRAVRRSSWSSLGGIFGLLFMPVSAQVHRLRASSPGKAHLQSGSGRGAFISHCISFIHYALISERKT